MHNLLTSKNHPGLSEEIGGVSGTRIRKPSSSFVTENHQHLWQSIQEILEVLSPLSMPQNKTEILRGFEDLETTTKQFRVNAALLIDSLHASGANTEAENVK